MLFGEHVVGDDSSVSSRHCHNGDSGADFGESIHISVRRERERERERER